MTPQARLRQHKSELRQGQQQLVWSHTGYSPHAEQEAVHDSLARIRLVAGGERGGKSRLGAEELAAWLALRPPELPGLYWIVGPDYEQARPEMRHLIVGAEKCGILDKKALSLPANGPWRLITTRGHLVLTRTGRDVRTLAGEAPDGILMVEAAQQSYEAFLRLRGRVAEKRAPLLLIGTFEHGSTWFSQLFDAWQSANLDGGASFSVPTWSNLSIYPGGCDDPEIKALERTYPADVFQERFGAVPCPPATLVFKEFSHVTHVKPCPFDPDQPVQLWIDPGYAGAYAVVVVQFSQDKTPREVYQIDEVYWTQRTVQEVILECKQREWWSKVHHCVIDVAGRQHPGMESHAEAWHRLAGLPCSANAVGIPDGILRHRTFLRDAGTGQPRLYHDPRCVGTIAEYGKYKYHEIEENRPVRELPIDADNHAMKAIAYGLVANFGFVAPPQLQPLKVTWKRN